MASEDSSQKQSKFKRFVSHRYFLMTIIVIVLALLIWFVGDAFAIYNWRPLEARWVRLTLIILVALGFVGSEVWRWYRAQKANEALLAGISQAELEADARAADELKVLRERFEEAAKLLKNQKFQGSHGRTTLLNQLPWYIFIGAPGSGKTTALMHCGLKFPLAGRDGPLAIKGVGGTRNCDWWFTNQAVFLDTAGRYTTQESNQRADSKAWIGFLELLKRFRSGVPLNGAIITLSVSDLLTFDEAGLQRYGDSVRARIQELYDKLGVAFPIYLVVTKSDLLAGFSQFFSDLGTEDRAQVWGCTFPYQRNAKEAQEFSATFEAEFQSLERQVFARLVARTVQERDGEARAMIYAFPGQFSAVGPLIKRFIDYAFQPSRFDRVPLLRGVYFTSGTQEGAPIDRVLGSLSRSLGLEQRVLPPSAVTGKSYFLKKLLEEVVFAEAGLVGFDEKRLRRSRLVMRAGFALLAIIGVGLAVAWSISYVGNRQLIGQTRDHVAAVVVDLNKLPSDQADLAQTLAALNKIRDLPYGYAERERSRPLWQGFGLFQGEKLGTQAQDSYRRVLGQTLLPRLALELEAQMRNPADDQVLYEALKAYLMLYDDPHLEPASLEAWVERLLPAGGSEEMQSDLVGHLRAAMERRPLFVDFARNDDLVADARRRLANASLPDRAFARLKLLGASGGVNPFRVADAAGPAASQVFVRVSGEPLTAPFPAIYTRDGYYKSFKEDSEKLVKQLAEEEHWVLGRETRLSLLGSGTAELLDEVRRRYFSEYVLAWEHLLADIRLRRSGSLTETILLSRVLSGPDSPLKRLAVAVSRETTLIESRESKTGVAAVTEAVSDATKNIVGRIAGGVPAAALNRGGRAPELVVDEHFVRLRQLVGAAAGQPAPIDQTLALLGEFSKELADLESKVAAGATGIQALPTAVRVKAEAETMPAPVQQILRGLIESTTGQAAAANKQAIDKSIGGAVGLCQKAVAGRYPLVAAAKTEVGIDDFNSVFRAGGDLDTFFKTNLQSLVDTSGSRWKLREGADKIAAISPDTVTQFQYADAIRQAFFRGSPYAGFVADLVYVSPDVGRATLEYDGEVYKLGSGQSNMVKLRWPGQRPAQPARLYLGWSSGTTGLTAEGTWSLFRLMDRASFGEGTERVRLAFDIDGKKLDFELRLSSVYNPFRIKEMRAFRCPGKA
jgi:type VI secretion system protein ImpL